MGFLNTLLYFIITVFVLVTVHEFGHFIAARIFGMWVPVFSVGMGRRLFGFNKLNGFTFGPLPEDVDKQLGKNTDYRLAVLPIGGYAKIEGMIDETQTEYKSAEPKPYEFRAKPWWQKSIVISAGVIMNLLLAIAIFIGIRYTQGRTIRATTTVGYVKQNSLSDRLGLHKGDKILSVDGKKVQNWDDLEDMVTVDLMGKDFQLVVDREGVHKAFTYRTSELGKAVDPTFSKTWGLLPIGYGAAKVGDVIASRPADRIGLKKGDVITRVNGEAIENQESLIDNISANPNKEIEIVWMRAGQEMSAKVTPDADGRIGIEIQGEPYSGPIIKENYSFFQAIPLGYQDFTQMISLNAKGFAMLFTGEVDVSKNVGGPIKIAKMAGESAGLGMAVFFRFMALFSISLAFLNILPIPALDGGHLVIILLEAVLGRELSQKFKMGFQKVGVALILVLMVFMVFNDLRGL